MIVRVFSPATLLALAGVSLLPSSISAQPPKSPVEKRYSADYNRCMNTGDAANGVTSGIMDCTGQEIDRQDARLNQAYKMVMAGLNPNQKANLRDSERSWIPARDGRCHKASSAEEGGSLAGVIYQGCILDETIKRTMYLETYRP